MIISNSSYYYYYYYWLLVINFIIIIIVTIIIVIIDKHKHIGDIAIKVGRRNFLPFQKDILAFGTSD